MHFKRQIFQETLNHRAKWSKEKDCIQHIQHRLHAQDRIPLSPKWETGIWEVRAEPKVKPTGREKVQFPQAPSQWVGHIDYSGCGNDEWELELFCQPQNLFREDIFLYVLYCCSYKPVINFFFQSGELHMLSRCFAIELHVQPTQKTFFLFKISLIFEMII